MVADDDIFADIGSAPDDRAATDPGRSLDDRIGLDYSAGSDVNFRPYDSSFIDIPLKEVVFP